MGHPVYTLIEVKAEGSLAAASKFDDDAEGSLAGVSKLNVYILISMHIR